MEMYLAGCCRDAGRDIGDYGPSDLLKQLRVKAGLLVCKKGMECFCDNHLF